MGSASASSAGFDGHGGHRGNDGIVDINDVELTLAPTYFGSERVSESGLSPLQIIAGIIEIFLHDLRCMRFNTCQVYLKFLVSLRQLARFAMANSEPNAIKEMVAKRAQIRKGPWRSSIARGLIGDSEPTW